MASFLDVLLPFCDRQLGGRDTSRDLKVVGFKLARCRALLFPFLSLSLSISTKVFIVGATDFSNKDA